MNILYTCPICGESLIKCTNIISCYHCEECNKHFSAHDFIFGWREDMKKEYDYGKYKKFVHKKLFEKVNNNEELTDFESLLYKKIKEQD